MTSSPTSHTALCFCHWNPLPVMGAFQAKLRYTLHLLGLQHHIQCHNTKPTQSGGLEWNCYSGPIHSTSTYDEGASGQPRYRGQDDIEPQIRLQHACHKYVQVKFKTDAKPVFCKPRTVPYSMLEDLTQTYEDGLKRTQCSSMNTRPQWFQYARLYSQASRRPNFE